MVKCGFEPDWRALRRNCRIDPAAKLTPASSADAAVRGSQAQDWFSFLYLGFECRDALREFGVTQTTWCFTALPMCSPKEFEETVMTTVVGFGAGNAQFDPQTATRERRTQAPKAAMTMRTFLEKT